MKKSTAKDAKDAKDAKERTKVLAFLASLAVSISVVLASTPVLAQVTEADLERGPTSELYIRKRPPAPAATLTYEFEPAAGGDPGGELVMQWENTLLLIPIEA